MESLRNRRNEKDCLKRIWKSSHMSQKIFDNDLVAIRKSKVTVELNKQVMLGCVYWIWVKYLCRNSVRITLKISMVSN